jgi:hypothetical protein
MRIIALRQAFAAVDKTLAAVTMLIMTLPL